jgi:FtsP/CotA-like multicopper oxidase with cupredoxin domain
MFTRRDMLKLGIAGTGYFILGPDGKISYADDTNIPPSPFTEPFLDELPYPGLVLEVEPFFDFPVEFRFWVDVNTTRFFKIASEPRSVRFHSQLPLTPIWGYRDVNPNAEPTVGAGSLAPLPFNILGPTIVQLFGTLGPPRNATFTCPPDPNAPPVGGGFVVRHINCLAKNSLGFGMNRTTVHLHGGHHLARADGFPENIENRPGNAENPAIPDGFPCFIVMEPPGFVRPPDEPVCATPTPSVSEVCPDSGHVSDRQVVDYYYPILDPGVLDRIRCVSTEAPDPAERPSTQWYHDHLLDFTGPNAYSGLAGFVLCFDELDSNDENDPRNDEGVPGVTYPKPLRLPSFPYDIPLAIQDKRFDQNGRLVFSSFDHDGFLGDKFLVNGQIQPFLEVKKRKYRFRFLNASNARIYRLFFNDGKPAPVGRTFLMDLIATEGGLLSGPLRGTVSILLAMAERLEVVFDFSGFDVGTELFVENRLPQTNGRRPDDGLLPQGSGNKLLKFIVTGDPPTPDNSQVPDVLRPFAEIPAAEIARAKHRFFKFDRSHGAWTINGELAGDLERPITTPKRGQPEIWHLENSSGGWWHPVHIHSEFFRVLRRNGQVPSVTARNPVVAERDGLAKKDTILLKGGDTVDLFLKFRDHLGPFVFHCHNMEHEDMAMMGRFDVVP